MEESAQCGQKKCTPFLARNKEDRGKSRSKQPSKLVKNHEDTPGFSGLKGFETGEIGEP